MLFEESRQGRKLVGRVERGEDLIDSLTALCKEHAVRAAELRGVGSFQEADVVSFDPAAKNYRPRIAGGGPFEVVQLNGNVSVLGDEIVVRADVLLAAEGPAGQQLVFGQLRSGTVLDFEFVLETFDDIVVERRLDAATGLLQWASIASTEPEAAPKSSAQPAPAPAAQPPADKTPAAAPPEETPRRREPPQTVAEPAATARPPASWDEAIKASEEIKPAREREERTRRLRKDEEPPAAEEIYGEYDFEEPILSAGDILDHPKLGECRVIKVEDDEYAHIRLSRGQIRKLSLEVCELQYEGERDGRSLFKVRVRR